MITMAGDVQYNASATYPPSSSNKRRATHHNAAPSHTPKIVNGSRSSHGRGTASAALNRGVAIFLATEVKRTGKAATRPVNGEEFRVFSPAPVRPEAM